MPYAERFGIWRRSRAARRYHALLEREWQPYLEGRVTFDAAIERVVDELPGDPGGG